MSWRADVNAYWTAMGWGSKGSGHGGPGSLAGIDGAEFGREEEWWVRGPCLLRCIFAQADLTRDMRRLGVEGIHSEP